MNTDPDRHADTVRLVSHPEPRHRCALPNWWRRWKLKVVQGSVVECLECGQRWEWTHSYGGNACWAQLIDGYDATR